MPSSSTHLTGLVEELKELIHVFAAGIVRICGSSYRE